MAKSNIITKIIEGWEKKFYGKQIGKIYEELSEEILDFLKLLKSGNKILDLGCGDGKYSFFIGSQGFSVLGIDISREAVKIANNYKGLNRIENVDFRVGNITSPKLSEDSVDAIFLINSYHCLTSVQRSETLNEVERILKRKGFIFISILSLKDESYPRTKWTELEENTFQDKDGRIFHFFDKREIKQELKNFRILKIKELINLKPDVGRESALFIVFAQKTE